MTLLRRATLAVPLAAIACTGSSAGDDAAPGLTVRASVAGPNEVLIEWDPIPDPNAGYALLRDAVPIAPPSTATSWLDLDVRAGTTVRYTVEARRPGGGTVAALGEISVSTPATAPRWFVEEVRRTGGIGACSAESDDGGVLHAAFHDAYLGALFYARDDGAGLVPEEVTRGASTGLIADLAVAAAGGVEIAFARDRDLMHAERDLRGAWTLTTIAAGVDPGAIGIAVTPAGATHIVYRAAGDYVGLRAASRIGGTWSQAFVPALGPTIGPVDLVATDDDDLVVLYFAGDDVRRFAAIAERTAGTWSTRRLLDVDRPTGAIHRDARGEVLIALLVDGAVAVVTGDRDVWTVEATIDGGTIPRSVDIVSSRIGEVHVALHGRAADLVHATRRDGRWMEEFVDADGNVGENAALAVAPTGRIDVVYNDVSGGALRRAQRD